MPTRILKQSLKDVIDDTIGTMLDISVREVKGFDMDALRQLKKGGVVHILGDWLGSVAFRCSEVLGEQLAAKMFSKDLHELDDDLKNDALREIANIIGGNVKCVLGKKCILSVPKTLEQVMSETGVQEGKEYVEVYFLCNDEPLDVVVYVSEVEIPA